MWQLITNLFVKYAGHGLIIGWFLFSLIYLFLTEKDKKNRVLFVYFPLVVLFLFFNPLWAKLMYMVIDDEIYYRLLWLVPMGAVIAYAGTKLYETAKGKSKPLVLLGEICLIMVSGSYMYANTVFYKVENIYHIPDTVVNVCEYVIEDGREVRAVFPSELIQYIRQYTPYIEMPYGRNVLVERWWYTMTDLAKEMERDEIDSEKLAEAVQKQWCRYLVIREDKEPEDSLENYDFKEVGRTDGYIIYRNTQPGPYDG